MRWFNFFFGSPQRTLWTLVVILMITGMINPEVIKTAFNNLLDALQPLINLAVTLMIIYGVGRWLFKKGGKK